MRTDNRLQFRQSLPDHLEHAAVSALVPPQLACESFQAEKLDGASFQRRATFVGRQQAARHEVGHLVYRVDEESRIVTGRQASDVAVELERRQQEHAIYVLGDGGEGVHVGVQVDRVAPAAERKEQLLSQSATRIPRYVHCHRVGDVDAGVAGEVGVDGQS